MMVSFEKVQKMGTNKKSSNESYWFNKKCCVPECNNCSTVSGGCIKEYFDLPAEPQARARWLKTVLVADSDNLKVCEDHFMEEDLFRDKTNRKKLRFNSTPSLKLPQHICSKCLGSTQNNNIPYEKVCKCNNSTNSKKETDERRSGLQSRIDEKRYIFRLIRKYGEVKYPKKRIKVNWNNVISHSKDSRFQNKDEVKKTWKLLRRKASVIANDGTKGTKLEKKVAKFLNSVKNKANSNERERSESTESKTASSDDEMQTNCKEAEEIAKDLKEKMESEVKAKEEAEDSGKESYDSEDEYYSIEDVEKKFGIRIKPNVEIISLLSSDESDLEFL